MPRQRKSRWHKLSPNSDNTPSLLNRGVEQALDLFQGPFDIVEADRFGQLSDRSLVQGVSGCVSGGNIDEARFGAYHGDETTVLVKHLAKGMPHSPAQGINRAILLSTTVQAHNGLSACQLCLVSVTLPPNVVPM